MDNRYSRAHADLGSDKAEQMMINDAMFIISGACNPVALAGVLHEQMVYRGRNSIPGAELKEDASIRMVLTQINYLVFGENNNPTFDKDYDTIADRVQMPV